MIEGLKPYADYKKSGIPWLETIPRHWQTARNGNLFQQRNDTRHPELPVLEVSLRTGVQVREFGSSKRKQVMADATKYKRASAGDIAYNMMRMWQGAVGVAPVDGLVSPAYVVARPFSGTNSCYYASLFKNGLYMSGALVGNLASAGMTGLKADIALVGASGLDPVSGPGTTELLERDIKAAWIKNARRTVLLCDVGKWASASAMGFAKWGDISDLVTDRKPPASFRPKTTKIHIS